MDVECLQRQQGIREGRESHEPGEHARMTPTRRLEAIMTADVAGFSATMERTQEIGSADLNAVGHGLLPLVRLSR